MERGRGSDGGLRLIETQEGLTLCQESNEGGMKRWRVTGGVTLWNSGYKLRSFSDRCLYSPQHWWESVNFTCKHTKHPED